MHDGAILKHLVALIKLDVALVEFLTALIAWKLLAAPVLLKFS